MPRTRGATFATGVDTQNRQTVLAAVWGGEVSNDHHAYYEAAFARAPTGKLMLLGVRRYWFDFAGLEGAAHWLGALGGGLIGVACSLVSLFGWLPTRKAA
jgi:hypothetical protein